MSDLPHQVQRKMDIEVDSADLTTYVKLPQLRGGKWTATPMTVLIHVAAMRHQWRVEIAEQLKWLEGDDDE